MGQGKPTNDNIVRGFICRNQDILSMNDLGLGGKILVFCE